MHAANLSLELKGTTLVGLAPAYDISPAAWAPRAGELIDVAFSPERPDPADAEVAQAAWQAARDLWRRVSGDPRLSTGFRQLAADNERRVAALAPLLALLPG